MYKKIFIDLDGVYKEKKPNKDIIVLTNLYNNEWVVNVNRNNNYREEIYERFQAFKTKLNKNNKLKKREYEMILFNNFFYPLGQWLSKIEELSMERQINLNTRVEFSTLSSNSNVFLIEAEGETNGGFLYEKYFYLSFYLNKYFINRGYKKISYKQRSNIKGKIYFYLRVFTITHALLTKTLLTKLFTRKRFYNINVIENKTLVGFALRGIIQSQFIEGMYSEKKDDSILIVNELSIKPFVNLNLSKKIFKSFFYAEDFVDFKFIIKIYFLFFFNFFRENKKKDISEFYGINIETKKIAKELEVLNIKYQIYGESVKNAINQLEIKKNISIKKIFSFEMLDPYPLYLKRDDLEISQIQTTLISSIKYPSFVYGNKFFFTSKKGYKKHKQVNEKDSSKYDLLDNLKYFKLEKKKRVLKINKLTYFCQPIYLDEEESIIKWLNVFCNKNKIQFYIKLHPRSVKPNFVDPKIIIDGEKSSLEAILDSDIVITRNSSIGLDAWYTNTPVLFCTFGTLKSNNVDYIPSDYSGNFEELEKWEKLSLNEFINIIKEFYSHKFHRQLIVDKERIIKEIFK